MTSVYRLSPNEQDRLLREKNAERKKLRLLKVREQEKELARRQAKVNSFTRESERLVLDGYLQSQTEAFLEEELKILEGKYASSLEGIGEGQRDAQYINNESSRIHDLRGLLAAKQKATAQQRHIEALKRCSAQRKSEEAAKEVVAQRRKEALEADRRAARSLAGCKRSTAPAVCVLDLPVDKGRKVKLREVEGYSLSYYHIPGNIVRREEAANGVTDRDAYEMAREASDRDSALQFQSQRARQERDERSRLRHKRALEKVRLFKEKERLVAQIVNLEREDRTHRQKALARRTVPLFQPPQQRLSAMQEQQREMEQAFEGLFFQKK